MAEEYHVTLQPRGSSQSTPLATLPSLEIADRFAHSHAHGKAHVSRLQSVGQGVWRITADGDIYLIVAVASHT